MARNSKGPQAERDTVALLVEMGFPDAQREYGAGRTDDVGDIRGVPRTTLEVKNQKTHSISSWLQEAIEESNTAGTEFPVLIVKRDGKNIRDGYFIMRVEDGFRLLKRAVMSDDTLRKQLEDLLAQ